MRGVRHDLDPTTSAMFRRLTALLVLTTAPLSAFAIQPVEAGLQPLRSRIVAIDASVTDINRVLEADDSSPEDRADAYRRFQRLMLERNQLARQIDASLKLSQSSLVMYATPSAANLTEATR